MFLLFFSLSLSLSLSLSQNIHHLYSVFPTFLPSTLLQLPPHSLLSLFSHPLLSSCLTHIFIFLFTSFFTSTFLSSLLFLYAFLLCLCNSFFFSLFLYLSLLLTFYPFIPLIIGILFPCPSFTGIFFFFLIFHVIFLCYSLTCLFHFLFFPCLFTYSLPLPFPSQFLPLSNPCTFASPFFSSHAHPSSFFLLLLLYFSFLFKLFFPSLSYSPFFPSSGILASPL